MRSKQQTEGPRWVIARSLWQASHWKIAGAALVLAMATVIAAVLSMYSGRYISTASVTVDAPRAGLVLDRDAKVKFRGVEIGRVAAIARAGDRVRLRMDLDPDLLRRVPDNARVDIHSTTVFGAKYVNFLVPKRPSGRSLLPGAQVTAEAVTVEFDTLFQHLADLLAKVEPGKLNATVNALGTALQGRGATLGHLLSRTDSYLRDINPSLRSLRPDLDATSEVTGLYADTAGDLLRTMENATTTSVAIIDQQSDLDTMLLNLVGLTDTTGAVLHENEPSLIASLQLLRPTTSVLYAYAPALDCVVNALGELMPIAEEIFGGRYPGAYFNSSFMFAAEPYKYPDDLPRVHATGGPHCHGVDDRVPGSHSDYIVTDTGEGRPFIPSTTPHPNNPPVFELLFAGLPGVGGR
ncbi:MCE family protein [Nocardia sp. NPDC051463]|uniref:MCE family protein n=1 Tax=Nocardia sp. NPDC051463 TaxID=3154845 RepID=UPI00344C82BF